MASNVVNILSNAKDSKSPHDAGFYGPGVHASLEPLRLSLTYLHTETRKDTFRKLIDSVVDAQNSGAGNLKLLFKALQTVEERAQRELDGLESDIEGANLPLSSETVADIDGAHAFLDRVAEAYSRPVAQLYESNKSKPMPGVEFGVFRAVRCLERRAMLAWRVSSIPPQTLWTSLYENLKLAMTHGFARTPIGRRQATIEASVCRVMLTALSEPPQGAYGDLARVEHLLRIIAPLASINEALYIPEHGVAFAIGSKGVRPEVLREDQVRRGKDKNRLMIEVSRVSSKLDDLIAHFSHGVAPPELGLPEDADTQGWFTLLERLQSHWTGNRKRRFERKSYEPTVDVIFGLSHVWSFLREGAFRRRAEDRRIKDDGPLAESSEWAVTDQSAGGFAVKLMGELDARPMVGDLVAVRFRDHSAVYICLVRRLLYRNMETLELGVEMLAPRGVPVYVNLYRGKKELALMFSSLPGRVTHPVLLVPTLNSNVPPFVEVEMPKSTKVVELGEPLLRNSHITICKLQTSVAPEKTTRK